MALLKKNALGRGSNVKFDIRPLDKKINKVDIEYWKQPQSHYRSKNVLKAINNFRRDVLSVTQDQFHKEICQRFKNNPFYESQMSFLPQFRNKNWSTINADRSQELGTLNTQSVDSNYVSLNTQRIFTRFPNGSNLSKVHNSFMSNDSYFEAGKQPMLN